MKEDNPKPDDSDITTFGVYMVLTMIGTLVLIIIITILAMIGATIW